MSDKACNWEQILEKLHLLLKSHFAKLQTVARFYDGLRVYRRIFRNSDFLQIFGKIEAILVHFKKNITQIGNGRYTGGRLSPKGI